MMNLGIAKATMVAAKTVAVFWGISFGMALLPASGQQNAKLIVFKRDNKTFTTKSGLTYDTEGIQSVTDRGMSLVTDSGVVKIKPSDMPDDIRKLFGITDEKVKKAESAYARKRYDARKAAVRKKNAQRLVSGRKYRLSVTLLEEVDFGFICDAKYVEAVTKTVRTERKAQTLDRNRDSKVNFVDRTREIPVGLEEKMLLNGLPRALKPGKTWEGDTYIVGTYVYAPKVGRRGRGALPAMDIPLAFVKYNDAVEYRASTPADGSEGNAAGTGVAIHKDGFIMTSYRLVLNADRITVTIPGRNRAMKAKVVAKDPEENLAILKGRVSSQASSYFTGSAIGAWATCLHHRISG